MRPIYSFLCFVCLVSGYVTAFAWDAVGHRLISAIAYEALSPSTQRQVDELTEYLDPGYPALSRFLYISALPDQWRSQTKREKNEVVQILNTHYINLPWVVGKIATTPSTKTPTLLDAIALSHTTLHDPHAPKNQKALALAYVVHLVEDAHQPLHCINLWSPSFPKGDQGGNRFPIQQKYTPHLHAYWDQGTRLFLTGKQRYPLAQKDILRLKKEILRNYPTPTPTQVHTLDAASWVKESYGLAQNVAYAIAPNAHPSPTYQTTMRQTIAHQMILAGYRLAEVLNATLSPTTPLQQGSPKKRPVR